jgi:hypothetical protein
MTPMTEKDATYEYHPYIPSVFEEGEDGWIGFSEEYRIIENLRFCPCV